MYLISIVTEMVGDVNNILKMNNSPREQLNKLEKENKYVFHGTGSQIENFEPRQAHTIIQGKKVPDGESSIFASSFADYAVFMALVNEENCPKGYRSGCSYHNGVLTFRATKETLEQLTPEARGYVYVFNRRDFIQKNPSEWVSHQTVTPVSIVTVIRSDFTSEIQELKVK